MAPLSLKGLYAITDPGLLSGNALLKAVDAALANGVSILQYRNKTAPFSQRVIEAAQLRALCQLHQAVFLINDDLALCEEVEADGIHIGQLDTSLTSARDRLGPAAVIGVTCHNNQALVAEAEKNGASYVALGRFFPSRTKPNASPASIDDLRRIRQKTSLPIAAIGGINTENGGELLRAGADMLAVVHSLFAASSVADSTCALMTLFESRGKYDSTP